MRRLAHGVQRPSILSRGFRPNLERLDDRIVPATATPTFTLKLSDLTGLTPGDHAVYVAGFTNNEPRYLVSGGTFTPVGSATSVPSLPLSQVSTITLTEEMLGARIYFFIDPFSDPSTGPSLSVTSGQVVGPSPTDQNFASMYYDFIEFSLDAGQKTFTINTSQVDQFGFPVTVTAGTAQVGTSPDVTREEFFSAYTSYLGPTSDFVTKLVIPAEGSNPAYRIQNPGKFPIDSYPFPTFFDAEVKKLFDTPPANLTLWVPPPAGASILTPLYFTGTAATINPVTEGLSTNPADNQNYQVIKFTNTASTPSGFGPYYVFAPFFSTNGFAGKPPAPTWIQNALKGAESPSQMVFAGDGVFADSTNTSTDSSKPNGQYANGSVDQIILGNLENQLVAALNRGLTGAAPDFTTLTPPTATLTSYSSYSVTNPDSSISYFVQFTTAEPHGFQTAPLAVVNLSGLPSSIVGVNTNSALVSTPDLNTFVVAAGPGNSSGTLSGATAVLSNTYQIIGASRDATGLVTITTSPAHLFHTGQQVVISNLGTEYNGTFTITSVPNISAQNQFTYQTANLSTDTPPIPGTATAKPTTGYINTTQAWLDNTRFYEAGQVFNPYADALHNATANGDPLFIGTRAYAISYDDQGSFAPVITLTFSQNTTPIEIDLGKWAGVTAGVGPGGTPSHPVGGSLFVGGGNGVLITYDQASGTYSAQGTSSSPIAGYTGPIRVAAGDINGDGVNDIIAGVAPGFGSRVVVRDGVTGKVLFDASVFEASFTGGVFLAAGDFTGDDRDDLVVTGDVGAGARVLILDGASVAAGRATPLADFLGLADLQGVSDGAFRGGTRPAVGDVNGDGIVDLLIAAGTLGGPRVTIWDGASVGKAARGAPSANPIANFFIFEESVRDGVFIAAADLNGDGMAEVIAGGGPNSGPRVRIADAKILLSTQDADAAQSASFFAGDPNSRGGIRVAARFVDEDTIPDLITGSGNNLPSEVRVYAGAKLLDAGTDYNPESVFDPFGEILADGVFVG